MRLKSDHNDQKYLRRLHFFARAPLAATRVPASRQAGVLMEQYGTDLQVPHHLNWEFSFQALEII